MKAAKSQFAFQMGRKSVKTTKNFHEGCGQNALEHKNQKSNIVFHFSAEKKTCSSIDTYQHISFFSQNLKNKL